MPAPKPPIQQLRDSLPKPLNDEQINLLIEQQRESMRVQRDQNKARIALDITFGQPVPALLHDAEIDALCEQARTMMRMKAKHQREQNDLGIVHFQELHALRMRLKAEAEAKEPTTEPAVAEKPAE